MNIIKTNWINIIGVFVAVLFYGIVLNLIDVSIPRNSSQVIFAALILVCGFGIMFWGLFILLLIIFDLLLFTINQNNLKIKLLIEWLIISSPFIYGVIRYKAWIFVGAVIVFLITQLLREKLIKKMLMK